MPKAAYRSSCRDKHNRPQCYSDLGPLRPQSDALTTRLLRPDVRRGGGRMSGGADVRRPLHCSTPAGPDRTTDGGRTADGQYLRCVARSSTIRRVVVDQGGRADRVRESTTFVLPPGLLRWLGSRVVIAKFHYTDTDTDPDPTGPDPHGSARTFLRRNSVGSVRIRSGPCSGI